MIPALEVPDEELAGVTSMPALFLSMKALPLCRDDIVLFEDLFDFLLSKPMTVVLSALT